MVAPNLNGPKTGIVVGLNSGHVVSTRAVRTKPNNRRGALGPRTKMVREIIAEVAGFSPYERRAMELLKGGGVNGGKRAMRVLKKRLGGLKRAKRKLTHLQAAIESGQ